MIEMWLELAKYQPYADAKGFGREWASMCSEQTKQACLTAYNAASTCHGDASTLAADAQACSYAYSCVQTANCVVISVANAIEDAIKKEDRAKVKS